MTGAWRLRVTVDARVIDGCLVVLSATGSKIYDDPAYALIVPLLDGARSVHDIVALLGVPDRTTVVAALRRLHRDGYIVRGPAPQDPVARYVEGSTEAIRSYTVAVVADEGESIADTVRLLGCRVDLLPAGSVPDADLTVVVVDDYLHPDLARINAHKLKDGQPWIPVKPSGAEFWIGPRFAPYETGCWVCLADRLRGNRQIERYVAQRLGSDYLPYPPAGLLPGVDGMVAAAISAEILATAARLPSPLAGVMRTITLADFRHREHVLTRLPQCVACGDPARSRRAAESVPAALEDSPPVGSQWRRTMGPVELVERLATQVDPYLGVVSRLTALPRSGADAGHTVVAAHDFPVLGNSFAGLRRNLSGQSGGRGGTVEQARAGALGEAIERYSGVWMEGTATIESSWAALDRRAVHPDDILLYSSAQYAGRETWNAAPEHVLARVPRRFDENRPISFTTGWSLTHSEPVLLPAGTVWYGHPDLREHGYAVTDSNGCAAGGSLAEAVFHGLCELYERDAVAIWWYNRLPAPGAVVEDDPAVDRLRESYRRIRREFWVLDISTDLSMPSYAAVSRRDHEAQDVLFGFGAHPDPRTAVRRALEEMDQLLPLVDRHDEDGMTRYRTSDPAALAWFRTVRCEEQRWLMPHGVVPLPSTPAPQVKSVIDFYVDDLRRAGIETIVVDQTRPDIDLHVARVIAPGLRHFWRRTAPGRLFDVPVALGRRTRPIPESELNPRSVFL